MLQFPLKSERCKPYNPTKCDVINDVKLFPTVYRRIYCRKFLTLSNQTSRYTIKCIRIIQICSCFRISQLCHDRAAQFVILLAKSGSNYIENEDIVPLIQVGSTCSGFTQA